MFDAVDAGLVRELQRDGRASYQALAERTGISREAARARVQRLVEGGRVRIVGIVAPQVAGMASLAHVSLDVSGPAGPDAAALAGRPHVRFLSCTAGRRALVADLRAADAAELEQEFAALRRTPGVRGIEVFSCTALVKDAYSPPPVTGAEPVGLRPADLDAVDRQLLMLLQQDGRASYVTLAQQVGLSQPAVRSRVLRLVDLRAVHVTGLVAGRTLGVREAAGIGLGVAAGAAEVARAAAAVPGVNYVALGQGRYDVVCGVDAPDRAELLAGLEALRGLDGVLRGESWVHLEIVKESYRYDLPLWSAHRS